MLRVNARKLGASDVMQMSRDELEDYIADHSSKKNGKKGKPMATKAIKAVKKKRGRPKGSKNRVSEEETPKRRGRPPGSKNKNRAEEAPKRRGRPPKAEATRKSSSKRANPVGRPTGSGTGTRVSLKERIKWNRDFDFRDGSTQAYILNAIRKAAKKYDDTSDIREEVFERLVDKIGDVDELTFINRSTGKAHKGDAAEQRLRYYISRTMFDYAVATGQHDGAGNGKPATKKRAKAETTVKRGRGRPRKVRDDDDDDDDDEDEAPRRRGRPPGSKNKKRAPGRPRKDEKRGPGRPKGSKNKRRDDEDEAPRRGRPPGSKNKNKVSGKAGKAKRGRPKGSKNKVRA